MGINLGSLGSQILCPFLAVTVGWWAGFGLAAICTFVAWFAVRPFVVADRLSALAEGEFGDPLHLPVLPGDLHHLEREALEALADAPPELL